MLFRSEDFATLARSHSEDPGSGAQGGDLGFFARGTMVPAFENAAFALNVGAISEVVTTDYGYHLIRLSARQEAQIKPLAAVREEVRAGAQEFKLVWEMGGPKTYQFVRLEREPRLVKPAGAEAATGVKLTPMAGSRLPKLPALFPMK